ncbi:Uncharacterized protein ALO43_05403 [Pseudomonas tremae]|uniref:Uncharacterized protein n=1 Tax=Pseudomonas tremae TaxID=200454 RepID=A0AA40P8C9_9PSED|nr:Uncharacterized protein ALO43_05403 [Pseudomonas tremae]RMO09664.1 hypothetical protein ALQ48_05653 [Pseudomonas coronafaciens pv. zizaniae]
MVHAPEAESSRKQKKLYDKPTVGWRHYLRTGSRYRKMPTFQVPRCCTVAQVTGADSVLICLRRAVIEAQA